MSTVIKTIPNTTAYSKRQRYEFEIFDKSIKEIENLFKQDIQAPKRRKVPSKTSHNNNNNNNYTYKDERLDGYLRKDQKSDSYKSLFSMNQNEEDDYQLREMHRKQQQQLQLQQEFIHSSHSTKKLPHLVHPSIINHIRVETSKKIDYFVNDISTMTIDEESSDLAYNEDGLFLRNDKIITNLINIIDSNK